MCIWVCVCVWHTIYSRISLYVHIIFAHHNNNKKKKEGNVEEVDSSNAANIQQASRQSSKQVYRVESLIYM